MNIIENYNVKHYYYKLCNIIYIIDIIKRNKVIRWFIIIFKNKYNKLTSHIINYFILFFKDDSTLL